MLWWTLRELRSDNWTIRKGAVEKLGESKDPRAVMPLVEMLKDKESRGRQAAAEALGKIGDARAVEPLVAALKDEYTGVAEAAADALGSIRDARAVEPLVTVVTDKTSYTRGIAAARALGKIGDRRAVEPLIAALKEGREPASEAEALGDIGDARAVEPLVAALDHMWPTVREAAVHALGKIGDARAVEPLVVVLKDVKSDVRQAAAEALGKFGDTRAKEPLVTVLLDVLPSVRNAAKEALGRIDPSWTKSEAASRSIPIIVAALNDVEVMVKYAAADALGTIGDARAIEPLLALLLNPTLRAEAKEALVRIDPNWAKSEAAKQAIPSMVAALEDEWSERRKAATEALNLIDPNWAKSKSSRGAVATMEAGLSNKALHATQATVASVPRDTQLGILFDIDELGGGLYGHAAYKILFDAIDTAFLAGCVLSDGDTNATLAGHANQYCIAVDSADAAKIAAARNALSASNAKGLVSLPSRFLPGAAVSREPLVLAARIDVGGKLVDCKTGWVMQAWEESREKHQGPAPSFSATTS